MIPANRQKQALRQNRECTRPADPRLARSISVELEQHNLCQSQGRNRLGIGQEARAEAYIQSGQCSILRGRR